MVLVRFLELKNKYMLGLEVYPVFKEALAKGMGGPVSTVYEQDLLFKGYYLMPIGGTPTNYYNNNLVNGKTFLLSVVNSHIPFFIQDFKPAGLTNWRTFKDANTTIDAKVAVLISQGHANEEMLKGMREYMTGFLHTPPMGHLKLWPVPF